MHPTPIHEVLYRVQRRELQVDVAAEQINEMFTTCIAALPGEVGEYAEPDRNETPEDAIGAAVTSPPVGTLTSYAGMETKQTRSDEDLPLSESQREEEALLRQLEEEADVELEDEMELEDAIMEAGVGRDEPEEQS